MSSNFDNIKVALFRVATWWRGLVETIPPDLARCEFDCDDRDCSTERFDACDKRKEYASTIIADAQERGLGVPDGDVKKAY